MKNRHRSIPGPLDADVAALCTVGSAQAVSLTLFELGFLPGSGQESCATGIDNAGQVVGASSASGGDRAFSWQNGSMTSLGVMGDTPFGVAGGSKAAGINASGQVVGKASSSLGRSAFIWSSTTGMVDVHTLLVPEPQTWALWLAGLLGLSGAVIGPMSSPRVTHALIHGDLLAGALPIAALSHVRPPSQESP